MIKDLKSKSNEEFLKGDIAFSQVKISSCQHFPKDISEREETTVFHTHPGYMTINNDATVGMWF